MNNLNERTYVKCSVWLYVNNLIVKEITRKIRLQKKL